MTTIKNISLESQSVNVNVIEKKHRISIFLNMVKWLQRPTATSLVSDEPLQRFRARWCAFLLVCSLLDGREGCIIKAACSRIISWATDVRQSSILTKSLFKTTMRLWTRWKHNSNYRVKFGENGISYVWACVFVQTNVLTKLLLDFQNDHKHCVRSRLKTILYTLWKCSSETTGDSPLIILVYKPS